MTGDEPEYVAMLAPDGYGAQTAYLVRVTPDAVPAAKRRGWVMVDTAAFGESVRRIYGDEVAQRFMSHIRQGNLPG